MSPPIDQPRIGFCCTFTSPTRDPAEEAALNLKRLMLNPLLRLAPAQAFDKLSDTVAHNLAALDRQVAWVAALPPAQRMFRLMSQVLPGWDHPQVAPLYADADLRSLVETRLAATGERARAAGVRLSLHPAQHAILATTDKAFENARGDILYHVELLTMMGYGSGWHPHGAHINIHGGAAKCGVEGMRANLHRLPQAACDLLTIENDENSFGLDDLLQLEGEVAIVVDLHHHWIRSQGEYLLPEDPRIARIQASWRGVRPVAHISVSPEALIGSFYPDILPDFAQLAAAGFSAHALRAHSDMMWNAPMNALVAAHLRWADFEVEAKGKNLASAALAAEIGV